MFLESAARLEWDSDSLTTTVTPIPASKEDNRANELIQQSQIHGKLKEFAVLS